MNIVITKEAIQEARLKNPKGFFLVTGKGPNRRQRRAQERWMAKNHKRLAYAQKMRDKERQKKLEEEMKEATSIYTKTNIWAMILRTIKNFLKFKK